MNPLAEKLWQEFKRFLPSLMPVDRVERFRSCVGALFGIAITGAVSFMLTDGNGSSTHLWLLAPLGASAVLLFALPQSPVAHPWAFFWGNFLSAIVAVTCAQLISAPLVAASLAVSLSVAVMFAFHCVHPPGGAIALIIALGGKEIHDAGYAFILSPVLINLVVMQLAALFYNRAVGREWPPVQKNQFANTKQTPADAENSKSRISFTSSDLDEVLKRHNQPLYISRDDLEDILVKTEMHALQRRLGEHHCGDIMRRDVVSVDFGTDLETAWQLMQLHKIKALSVLDRGNRVIGIVTPTDFLRHAGVEGAAGISEKIRHLLRPSGKSHSTKAEVVGQIMTSPVVTVHTDTPITELLPLLVQRGLRHVPVLDEENHFVGLLTQGDMVAALYSQRIAGG